VSVITVTPKEVIPFAIKLCRDFPEWFKFDYGTKSTDIKDLFQVTSNFSVVYKIAKKVSESMIPPK
jgi:hypothetical protein